MNISSNDFLVPEKVLEILDLQERAYAHHEYRYYAKDEDARLDAIVLIRQFHFAGDEGAELATKLGDHFIYFECLHFYGTQMLFHYLIILLQLILHLKEHLLNFTHLFYIT